MRLIGVGNKILSEIRIAYKIDKQILSYWLKFGNGYSDLLKLLYKFQPRV